ncbi:uncharacterized protein LOC143034522 isoform X2 [Oratosquilla oratoria]|uniref:uncharacterized protein LOC143034522 isoform X2 n=1 Tax=Oratosquilla oratoria TaxID=337810 RepID=UPI003F769E80
MAYLALTSFCSNFAKKFAPGLPWRAALLRIPLHLRITPTTTSDPCGNCDRSFSVAHRGNTRLLWSSPNYPKNYPEDCNCTLLVRITGADSFHIGFATGSEIYDASGCNHDRLVFTGDVVWKVCGSGMDQFALKHDQTNTSFTATFISDSGDGNKVATGFEMTLDVHIP